MKLDLDRVRDNVRKATTEDLLDRATVFRADMEPEALSIIEAELASRGLGLDEIEAHLRQRSEVLYHADGSVVKCNFCWNPAIRRGWGWHFLFGRLPVFPRYLAWCAEHLPPSQTVYRGGSDRPPGQSESL